MLSRALITHIRRTYHLRSRTICPTDDADRGSLEADEDETEEIRLDTDDSGSLIRTNQVWDYFLRDDRLRGISFYDFVQRYTLVRAKNRQKAVWANVAPIDRERDQPNARNRFTLKATHQLSHTHELQETRSNFRDGLIPHVYGCAVPRESNTYEFALFCLAHFKPFSVDDPLLTDGVDVEALFRSFSFSE